MSVVWSGVTESGAVVPVQVDALGRVIATTGEPPSPPVINYNGASSWGAIAADGTVDGGLNVETIRRPGTGTYNVVFTTSMPNSNYSVVGSCTGVYTATNFTATNQTAAGFTIRTYDTVNAKNVDASYCFAVFSINALPPKGGTGTDAWGSVLADGTLNASFNTSSVEKTGFGGYRVYFTTPMPSSDYAVNVTVNELNGGETDIYVSEKTSTYFKVISVLGATGYNDKGFAYAVNATNATLPLTVTKEQLDAVINNWQKTGDTLSTDDAVEMNGPVRLAGGKAGFTDEGQIYFTPGPGPQKYLLEVQEGQMQLKRIDSAY